MNKVEKATSWMESIALDDSHGYDQNYRWGEYGDYDCSALVITAWRKAGVNVTASYTGNMRIGFLNAGFENVTSKVNLATGEGLKRGDILLNEGHHTALYCGNYREVEASINERGDIVGGVPGDQTGYEILIRSYRNYPWNVVLRYPEQFYAFDAPVLKKHAEGHHVFRVKAALKARGYYKASLNYVYGNKAKRAMRNFQKKAGLRQTGNANAPTNRTLFGLEIDGNGRYIVYECRNGDTNKSVLLLQEFLKALGYYTDGKLDWTFGDKTEKALIEFKKAANKNGARLGESGVWDVQCIKYMIG